jgi:hypothetical protein
MLRGMGNIKRNRDSRDEKYNTTIKVPLILLTED